MDDQLSEACRRIDRLERLAEIDGALAASPLLQCHLDALHEGRASVRAAARRAADPREHTIGRLMARLAVAEHAVLADLADDWETFAAGVEAELRSWNSYLERVAANVDAVINVDGRRVAVFDQLLRAGDRQEQRIRVTAARRELAQAADQLSARDGALVNGQRP